MIGTYLLVAMAVVAMALAIFFSRPSRTAREATLPWKGKGFPRAEVKAALERMGCLVSDDGGSALTGLLSDDGPNWGQEVTVTTEPGRLRVRSAFSGSQAFGASKNQENVDRFLVEWERRTEFEAAAADPAVREASELKAREVARNALWGGGLATAAGLALLLFAFLAPSREGYSGASSKIRLIGLALIPIAYGLPRVMAAVARLRK
jgi:hypothetical protein